MDRRTFLKTGGALAGALALPHVGDAAVPIAPTPSVAVPPPFEGDQYYVVRPSTLADGAPNVCRTCSAVLDHPYYAADLHTTLRSNRPDVPHPIILWTETWYPAGESLEVWDGIVPPDGVAYMAQLGTVWLDPRGSALFDAHEEIQRLCEKIWAYEETV